MKKVLFVFGTRPEAIKLAPLIKHMQTQDQDFDVKVCVTGQHREMLYQVLDFFSIIPDYDLEVMEPSQTLFMVTSKIIHLIEPVFDAEEPDVVIVQGDTTSVLMGALGAFYKRVPVAHVEAGLRTGDIYSPFPEEINRLLVSRIAKYHFTPTSRASDNLVSEGVDPDTVHNVGNTVIDALMLAKDLVDANDMLYAKPFSHVNTAKKVILVTSHRRESVGEGLTNIMSALSEIATRPDVEIVFPIHYSPAVRDAAKKAGLYDIDNIHILDPLDYPHLVYIMNKSHLILTDSGGIQEEAPSLGKPVLVMRDTTERPEGIDAGVAKLVGTDESRIIEEVLHLLDNQDEYDNIANTINPYGDGHTSSRIASLMLSEEVS